MKQLMILGGLTGFLIGVGFGWLNQSPWPNIVWRALIVTYAAALLMRWWGQLWIRGLRESQRPLPSSPDDSAAPAATPAPAK